MTGPQVWAIKVIAQQGSVRISELAKRMYLHPATVGGILDRLEKRGLIARCRSKADRRVVDVELTDEGRRLVQHSPEVASNKITQGLEMLPFAELAIIHHGLERLTGILDARELAPQLIGSGEVNAPPKTLRR